jgi:hypothetical protein
VNEDFRLCGSCGRPLDGDFVTAEPLLSMRGIRAGAADVLVAGAPQCFHPQHVPTTGRWRVLTA